MRENVIISPRVTGRPSDEGARSVRYEQGKDSLPRRRRHEILFILQLEVSLTGDADRKFWAAPAPEHPGYYSSYAAPNKMLLAVRLCVKYVEYGGSGSASLIVIYSVGDARAPSNLG